MNTQDWSPLGWTGWISLQSKGLSRVFSNTIVQKQQSILGAAKGSGFQPVVILPPGGYLAMSGDIFGCHNWVGVVTGIERPEKLLIALEGTGQPSTTKNYPSQSANSVEAKKML